MNSNIVAQFGSIPAPYLEEQYLGRRSPSPLPAAPTEAQLRVHADFAEQKRTEAHVRRNKPAPIGGVQRLNTEVTDLIDTWSDETARPHIGNRLLGIACDAYNCGRQEGFALAGTIAVKLQQADLAAETHPGIAFVAAMAAARLGQKSQAIEWMKRVAAARVKPAGLVSFELGRLYYMNKQLVEATAALTACTNPLFDAKKATLATYIRNATGNCPTYEAIDITERIGLDVDGFDGETMKIGLRNATIVGHWHPRP